jgi:flagellar basal-body rod modification protein FlgD
MAVGAVNTTAATTSTSGGTGSTKSGLGAAAGLGKDDFMQLLIAQLRNQDPMKPMEDKEFISQLAQFSSLEATEKMTAQLEELSTSGIITQAATLLGKQVTAKLTSGETVTGTVSQVKIVGGKPVAVVNGTELETSLINVIGTASTTTAGAAGAAGANTAAAATANTAAAATNTTSAAAAASYSAPTTTTRGR